MEYYVSYHKIIEFFKQIQQNSPRLKTMGHGDIVYFSENITGDTTAVYPYMFVTPELITYNESTTNYQFNVIFADIVNTDLSNEIDVISDMSIECKNFIASIYRGFLFDKIDIQLGEVAVPFMERFNDHTGGVYCSLTIIVFDDINACVEYPPPSATPTNTPTPSITPTNTPTISLTPTNTQTPTPSTTTTLTPTPTNTQTPTPTLTPTNTPTTTTTLTPTPSQTPTNTPTQTQTPTNTPTQTQTPTNTPSPTPLPLIVAGGLQFFSSANQNVKLSTDGGITWTNSSNSNSVFNLTHLAQAIGYNGSRWLAGSVIGTGQPTIAYSNNGSSWTASTNPNTIFSEVRGFAYGNSRWYAGGVATSGSSIATSTDGITWTGNTNITTGVFDINYNGSMFVVATTSLFYYSYDGLTYFSGNNYSNMTAPRKIAYDGSRYVGVGQGTNKIAYSDNGIDWYDSNNGNTISSGLTTVEGITWYGGMWIAGGFQQFSPGGNVIMYSYDGLNWSGGTNANSLIGRVRDIAWVGNKFVAVGGASNVVLNAKTIIYSTNGITWTAAADSIYNQTGGYAVVPAIYPPLS